MRVACGEREVWGPVLRAGWWREDGTSVEEAMTFFDSGDGGGNGKRGGRRRENVIIGFLSVFSFIVHAHRFFLVERGEGWKEFKRKRGAR